MRQNGSISQTHKPQTNLSEVEADRTEPNGGSPAAHEPELYDIEDLPAHFTRRGSNSQMVRPYDIEEPDENTAPEIKEPSPPKSEQRRDWEDLVDSMEGLYCGSDNSNSGTSSSMRGRKRKSPTTPGLSQSGRHRKSASVPDAQYERPSLSPKRPRKKDGNPRKSQTTIRSTQKDRIRRARALSGSSNTSLSTDTSGPNVTNGSPAPEAMDLD
ncbi:hypothetical protein BDV18DRAFT_156493 [Aspergillus unguis]